MRRCCCWADCERPVYKGMECEVCASRPYPGIVDAVSIYKPEVRYPLTTSTWWSEIKAYAIIAVFIGLWVAAAISDFPGAWLK